MFRRSELVHTYSIIAIDREAGLMGGAVQSHYFSVGGTVIWAEPGAGVVATQALTNIDYGPGGLKLLKEGLTAGEVIRRLTSEDPGSGVRQTAAIDTRGGVSAFTGESTIAEAGHIEGAGYSVQANMMLKRGVPEAMASAFEGAAGPLPDRLMAALEAAEASGGDIRGMQSASMTVVPIEDQDDTFKNMGIDIRVEDHGRPLSELSRLLNVHKAYEYAERGDSAMEAGDTGAMIRAYAEAERLMPGNIELRFWKCVSLLGTEEAGDAEKELAGIFRAEPNWEALLRRLPAAGIISAGIDVDELIRRIWS